MPVSYAAVVQGWSDCVLVAGAGLRSLSGVRPLDALQPQLARGVVMNAARSTQPRCADAMFGYGIGNCCGCNRFPVVLYKSPRAEAWRCESCYSKQHATPPSNLVRA